MCPTCPSDIENDPQMNHLECIDFSKDYYITEAISKVKELFG